jgi:hypothetical protein
MNIQKMSNQRTLLFPGRVNFPPLFWWHESWPSLQLTAFNRKDRKGRKEEIAV